MELSQAEILAIELLKPHQSLVSSMLNGGNGLDLNKVYDFYATLNFKLSMMRVKRKNEFEEVNSAI